MGNFVTIPNEPRVVKATEARLEKLYEAARLGLKGDSLALSAGLSPEEYRLMSDLDPMVALVEKQARADSERTHSAMLAEASLNGDAKASLAILQHQHGWAAKQEIDIRNTYEVNIKDLLSRRAERIKEVTSGNTYDAE